jgi:hypothetical protein
VDSTSRQLFATTGLAANENRDIAIGNLLHFGAEARESVTGAYEAKAIVPTWKAFDAMEQNDDPLAQAENHPGIDRRSVEC